MPILFDISVPFRSGSGEVVAHVNLMPVKDAGSVSTAPLVEIDSEDAREFGETVVQLRESERYEYEVVVANGVDLRLRCSLSRRRRSLGNSVGKPDGGLLETRSFCGMLLLELVEGEALNEKSAVASALLNVRSLKLDYRTEYRGMLRRLSDEIAGLVVDARSSAKASFHSTFEDRTDAGWLQIQLEMLREILDSPDFSASLQRILSFPHDRLSKVSDSIYTDRPIRWTALAARQLVAGYPRREVSALHPLRIELGLKSVAKRVPVSCNFQDLDTLENRFVKFALGEFRAFLTHAQGVFESCEGWAVAASLSRRLTEKVEDWLGRSLFREVGEMRFAPLGSPVLQRKAGYREVLRWWLRFRTAAEISWEGGEELFHAGQRDVASLYEYWLFFELLGWFCRKCRGGNRPAVEDLIEGLEEGSPNLRLRKQYQLGPFEGAFAGQSRRLNARFAYNRFFEVTNERGKGGSWTRRMHPDYTLTFWPSEIPSEAEAERLELLVHVHFDAKYRVEHIEDLFGMEDAEATYDEPENNYKRNDLLKMHAYRDAIKRSQGAYVLYPGRGNSPANLKGFHEILPGLGAFGIAPDEHGAAKGMELLEAFLDEVLSHLGNRTTAQERLSFHIAESYRVKELPVQYDSLVLAERDVESETMRELPPSEHHVVIAFYKTPEQIAWTLKNGIAIVQLSDQKNTWRIPQEMASARHVLLWTHGGKLEEGLLRLTKLGYKVYSSSNLTKKGYPNAENGEIYAVFEVESDPIFNSQCWDGGKLQIVTLSIEPEQKCSEFNRCDYGSAIIPRVLSLQELLKARL